MPSNPILEALCNKWCPKNLMVCCGHFIHPEGSPAERILGHLAQCRVATDFERMEALDDHLMSKDRGEWCGSRSTVLRDCHGQPAVYEGASGRIAAYGLDGPHADLYRMSHHSQFWIKHGFHPYATDKKIFGSSAPQVLRSPLQDYILMTMQEHWSQDVTDGVFQRILGPYLGSTRLWIPAEGQSPFHTSTSRPQSGNDPYNPMNWVKEMSSMPPEEFISRVEVYDAKTGLPCICSESETVPQYHSRIIAAVKATMPTMTGSEDTPSVNDAIVITSIAAHYPYSNCDPRDVDEKHRLQSIVGNDALLQSDPPYCGALAPAGTFTFPRMHGIGHARAVHQVRGVSLWFLWTPTPSNLFHWEHKCLPLPPRGHVVNVFKFLQPPEVILMREGQCLNLRPGEIHAVLSITESCHFYTPWVGAMTSEDVQQHALWLSEMWEGNELAHGGNPLVEDEYVRRKWALEALVKRVEGEDYMWRKWMGQGSIER